MSDEPVTATLTIDGVDLPVSGACVLVGPPDFAPAIRSYRSTYDTLVDEIVRDVDPPDDDGLFAGPLAHIAAMRADWKANGTIKDFRPSFTRDVAPIITQSAKWSACTCTSREPIRTRKADLRRATTEH
jgi:hypothetical protein